jgi:alginate O-acetyltransferase complex protein AlgI
MIFSGFPFLLGFLPLLLCGCALFGRLGSGWAKCWLIAVSLLFYGAGAAAFLPLLVLSICGNFILLHVMHGSATAGRWAAFGVALNLLVLGWFKYLGADPLPPLGLSFFTFTQIGCLLHHGDGNTPPPKARDYALFTAFFPALLAGPILNPREMLPQFARIEGWQLTTGNMAVGSGFFLIGLLKKTLLADPLSAIVAAGFADPASLTLFPAWQASTAYSLRLYFDFSGYTDMAVGLAWIVGLRFPDNFQQPYRAASIIAYWQSWHMSLTRFLMTNVHAPLTLAILRRRRDRGQSIGASSQRTAAGFLTMIGAPAAVTMLLVSLWHGATISFLLFGLLHTSFLLINHAWRLVRVPNLPPVAGVALTYLSVLVGSMFFRATTATDAVSMLAGMVGLHGAGMIAPDIRAVGNVVWLGLLYAIVWFAPTTRQWMHHASPAETPVRFAWRPSLQWAVVMGCAGTLGLLAAGGSGEFLYFRF